MCRDTAGWLMYSSRAAAENERCRAKAANALSRASTSITIDYIQRASFVFDHLHMCALAWTRGVPFGQADISHAGGRHGQDTDRRYRYARYAGSRRHYAIGE